MVKTLLAELNQVERWALGLDGRIKRGRGNWRPSREMMRLREIEKVIRVRHGRHVPDPGNTDDRDTCVAYIRAAAFSLAGQGLEAWCARWAPWATSADITPIIADAAKRRRMMNANGVAGLIGVKMEERTRLGLKTIGACDLTASERKAAMRDRKRDRDRERQQLKRRAEGRRLRNSPEGHSISKLQPWLAEGISRRTWYRRRGTTVSRVDIYWKGDTLVPAAGSAAASLASSSSPQGYFNDNVAGTSVTPSEQFASGEAGRDGVRGPSPRQGFQGAEPHGSGDAISEDAA